MAHFYSRITSKNTTHTKAGNKRDGMYATLNGWNIGVEVALSYNSITDKDEVRIYKTGGSNNSTRELIAEVKE